MAAQLLESASQSEEVSFNGFYKADTALKPGERIFLDFSFISGLNRCLKYFCLPPCSKICRQTMKNMSKQQRATPVQIHDARKKEAEEGLSKREFFEKYGFVLLSHETKMSAEDWLVNSAAPMPDATAMKNIRAGFVLNDNVPVKQIYAKEIDPIVRELIPGTTEVVYPRSALRRGPGGPNNFYGLGVHQDFGLYPEDMKSIFAFKDGSDPARLDYTEWRAKLQGGSCKGFSTINFWRPVLPMRGPVQNTPMAVCDPNSVHMDDIVPQDLYGFVPGGQHNMGIKFSKKQKWYYYPNMTKDEVLVFRQFHYDRDVLAPYKQLKTVFHTAFDHPGAPKDAEHRCSSEYRIHVFWK